MPLAMQADLLSMTYRAHLMSEYGLWGLSSNQLLAHYIYAFNLMLWRPFFGDLTSFFAASHGVSLASTTSSVGDWLTFVAQPQVNAFIFVLKLPHLLADLAIFVLLARFFRASKQRSLILAAWWFNPINLYAFYVFARHDSLTLLALLLALLFLAKRRILPGLLAFWASVQIRFQPLLYLPLLLAHLWRGFSLRQLWRPVLITLLFSFGFWFLQNQLPFDEALYRQVKGLPVLEVSAVSPPAASASLLDRAGQFLQKPFTLATSVGGRSTLDKLLLFTGVYLLLSLFSFLLRPSQSSPQAAFVRLSAILYLGLAAYFLLNDFSPHYFVWLSLFACGSLTVHRHFWRAYLLAILGWGLMGVFALGNFAINQNLFLPLSSLLFGTPQLAFLGLAPVLFTFGKILLNLGLLWSGFLILRQLSAELTPLKQWRRLWRPGALLVLGFFASFFLTATPAQAAKIPVLTVNGDAKLLLEPGTAYQGSFISPVAEFGALDLRFDTSRSREDKNIALRLKRSGAETWLYEATYNAADFYNQAFYPFGFPLVSDALDQEFVYEVQLLDAGQDALWLYADSYVISREGPLRDLLPLLRQELQVKWQAQQGFWLLWLGLLGGNLLAILWVLLRRFKNKKANL